MTGRCNYDCNEYRVMTMSNLNGCIGNRVGEVVTEAFGVDREMRMTYELSTSVLRRCVL